VLWQAGSRCLQINLSARRTRGAEAEPVAAALAGVIAYAKALGAAGGGARLRTGLTGLKRPGGRYAERLLVYRGGVDRGIAGGTPLRGGSGKRPGRETPGDFNRPAKGEVEVPVPVATSPGAPALLITVLGVWSSNGIHQGCRYCVRFTAQKK